MWITCDVALFSRPNFALECWKAHGVYLVACLNRSIKLQKSNIIFELPHVKAFMFEKFLQTESLLIASVPSPTMGPWESKWNQMVFNTSHWFIVHHQMRWYQFEMFLHFWIACKMILEVWAPKNWIFCYWQ